MPKLSYLGLNERKGIDQLHRKMIWWNPTPKLLHLGQCTMEGVRPTSPKAGPTNPQPPKLTHLDKTKRNLTKLQVSWMDESRKN